MTFPLLDPQPTPASAPWLEACVRRELRVGMCSTCGRAHFYPRAFCPHCHADDVSLAFSAGRGSVYAWTEVQTRNGPYTVAYVRLDDGVTLLTQLGRAPRDAAWSSGARVRVAWAAAPGGQWLPVFEADEGDDP